MGCHFLLQEIFPTQGSNLGLPHCRQTLLPSEPPGKSLYQIPYNYTVVVTSRFKVLDLIDRVPDELWMEVRDIVQETGNKTIPKKKNAKK